MATSTRRTHAAPATGLNPYVRRQLHALLRDYFPTRLTVLDRDTLLELVQATLDYARRFGIDPGRAEELLRIDDNRVEVEPPNPTFSAASVVKLPGAAGAMLAGVRHSPATWTNRTLPGIIAGLDVLCPAELGERSDAALLEIVHDAIVLRDRIFTSRARHFLPSFAIELVAHVLSRLLPGLRPSIDAPSPTDHPTQRFLRDLRRLAQARRRALDDPHEREIFFHRFAAFIDKHGGRGGTFVPLVSMPTWDSNPSDLMTLVDMMARDLDTSDTTEALPAKPPPAWLRSFIQRVQAIRVERDCVIFGYEYATRIMRSAITELGARLATRSELGDRTDIFHCRLCELESLVRYGTPLPLAQIEHRKAAYTEDDERRDTEAAASEIHGLRASPGAYTGLARVVLTPADFASVRRGDILVCAVTSPSWLPLLELAGAVVTDLGGMLSHAAIVAREFKIPAVTGTSVATRKMISGARYQVDGSRGVVRAVME